MARGVNKVILIGNLGADPDIRYLGSGDPVANISVATSESWRDKQTGQQQDRTEWHRVVIYGKMADVASKYMKKGTKVYIEGALRTRKWQDKSGQERYTTEIICNDLQLIDSRGGAGEQGFDAAPRRQQQPAQANNSSALMETTDIDEELPF